MLNFLFSFDGCSQPRKQAIGSSYTSDDRPKQTISYKTSIKFEDFRFLNKISKAKFPVYLVEATSINKKLAMKIFPFRDDQPSPRYQNEIRFSHLCHHNVIAMIDYKEEEINNLQGDLSLMSYIVMEYAPYGDLFDLVMNSGIDWHDKLVRTYFHQLVQGLEYLHSNGIAHLDLKLENVLMGENFVLKIADFDLSHFIRDEKVHTKGTKNYRPPELLRKNCEDAQAVDVYSIGIMLFVMKCEGVLPYLEDKPYKGIDLFDLLHNKPAAFWENHIRIQKKGRSFFDPSFKSLFMSMTQLDPKKRATLREIQASQWYRGPIYSEKELTSFMRDAWELLH